MWMIKKNSVMDEKVELLEGGVDLKFNTGSLRRDGRLIPTLRGIDWAHCVEHSGFCGSDWSYSQILWFVCHWSFCICQCLPLLHQKTLSWHCYPISSQCLSLYMDIWTLKNHVFCVRGNETSVETSSHPVFPKKASYWKVCAWAEGLCVLEVMGFSSLSTKLWKHWLCFHLLSTFFCAVSGVLSWFILLIWPLNYNLNKARMWHGQFCFVHYTNDFYFFVLLMMMLF